LAQGELVLLAPQGGRRPTLGGPVGQPLARLLEQLSGNQAERVALLPVGLGIDGISSYQREQVGGLNLFRRYLVNVGAVHLLPYLRQQGIDDQQIDAWLFAQLATVVPPAYRD